jgi:hypothetical protein
MRSPTLEYIIQKNQGFIQKSNHAEFPAVAKWNSWIFQINDVMKPFSKRKRLQPSNIGTSGPSVSCLENTIR